MKKYAYILLLMSLLTCGLQAEVKLPHIFSDNMILQRDKVLKIWGWADKGEKIQVSILEQTKNTQADESGYWSVNLDPIPYGGPYQMRVQGSNNTITFDNILIGDVWLCSGQSNMEMPVNGWGQVYNYEQEIKDANYPTIRAFNVEKAMSMTPNSDFNGKWQVCSPQTVSGFSAVAYFFARKLNKELNIPIGIINSSWGGTDIETWISENSFNKLPDTFKERYAALQGIDLAKFAQENEAKKQIYLNALKNDLGIKNEWFKAPKRISFAWKKMQVPQEWSSTELATIDGIVWFRYSFTLPQNANGKTATLNLGPIDDDDISWINGLKVGETVGYGVPRTYKIEKDILKDGVNTLTIKITDHTGGGGLYGLPKDIYLEVDGVQYPLAGEWEYKESVTNKEFGYIDFSPNAYNSLLYNAMINPITSLGIKGVIWYQGENNANAAYNYRTLFPTLINDWRNKWGYEFPFYWVQLANYMAKDDQPQDSKWAELREAQTMTLSLPYTGQAVITDIGDAKDIHPRNKQDVGLRLSLIALNKDYGRKDIIYSGPTFNKMAISGNKAIIYFDNIAKGLKVSDNNQSIKGFSIAGADNKFVWAKAYLDGDKVIVESNEVTNPVSVRYSWSNNPEVNLFNSEGLPAAPFRTDK
ncbi:sialate O-acetylesterase [Dysgonomonas alginatilytica]|uniref:Sialate O-acetylesterase n=1 Tax=Dysgonomonas alginatilytica TaxID=1605892 RepID=A0A2V3PSZ8_9BACT|nr:sialate O-acetylesterase [Dysgonomonas alginatilytica]PXV66743.1 sialate O-acetylesterase [Dysgonomonas alginatilytica]